MECSIMKKSINAASRTVMFTFEGLAPVVLDVAKVTDANRNHAMLHGFAARIGDNAAITKGPENGYKVTEAMRREAVLELVNHYESGSLEWNVRSTTPKAPALNAYVLELAQRHGVSYDVMMAKIAATALDELTKPAEVTDVTPKGEMLAIAQ
jgi:hypothetical protein